MFRPTSTREKRYWIMAAAVLAAIWASAGLAGRLAAALREHDLLGVAFGLAFLVTIVAVVGNAMRLRPGGREVWTALGIAAIYAMIIVRMGVSAAERSHLFEYGFLAVLVHEALVERRANGGRVAFPALAAIVITAVAGAIDELIQLPLPDRIFDMRDIGINALAAVMAVLASVVLRRARRVDARVTSATSPSGSSRTTSGRRDGPADG